MGTNTITMTLLERGLWDVLDTSVYSTYKQMWVQCGSGVTYYFSFLAKKCVALKSLIELTLRNIRKDLILSFIRCAVWNSGGERKNKTHKKEKNYKLFKFSSNIS